MFDEFGDMGFSQVWFLKTPCKFWCGEMCIWVVRHETKTPGYPSPERKFWKKNFSEKFQGATRTALGFIRSRLNARAGSTHGLNAGAGRSCADSMLVRIDGNKNEVVAIQKTIKTFLHPLFSTLQALLIIIIIRCNFAVMFATP